MNTDEENSSNNGTKSRFKERLKKIARDKKRKSKLVDNENKKDVRKIFKPFIVLTAFLYGSLKEDKKGHKVNNNVSQNDDNLFDETNIFDNSYNKKHNDASRITNFVNDDIELKTVITVDKQNCKDTIQEFNECEKNILDSPDEFINVHSVGYDNEENVENKGLQKDTNITTNCVVHDVKMKSIIAVGKQNCKDTIQEFNEYEKNALDNLDKLTNSNSVGYNNEKDVEIKKLQKDIIDLIKKRLVKNINELEILSSEFYILKEVFHDDTYLDECQDKIKDIKKLLSKIKSLKEKYDYLKNNIDFDDLLYIDDNSLVDKIIELKDICTNEDVKDTIDNYKILEEYKSLYLKIDKLEENVQKYNDYKEEKEKELKNRDIEFNKLKEDVYNKTYEQRRYDNFINEQDVMMKKLDEQLMKIDSREVVTYKLKGFNQLLGSSFKYLGLLMASPLKGLFPSITMQTIATRNIIYNLYNSLEWEKEKKIVYETENFSSLINSTINDLEQNLNLINTTVDDVRTLKEKYIKEFSKDQSSFSEYSEVIKKLNKIENAVLNNKVKIQLMQEKMREKEKENDNKMKMVKKLNCSLNN